VLHFTDNPVKRAWDIVDRVAHEQFERDPNQGETREQIIRRLHHEILNEFGAERIRKRVRVRG
jgi:hypothetical protein